ncbi:MAG: class I SAM-dependent methyltransferase [Kofleriaceae bacterium]|nr:class I SAM-dependent methyltransferase [Kofleriaceae bacterium]
MADEIPGLSPWLLHLCTCLDCGDALSVTQCTEVDEGGRTRTGILLCSSCERLWPILAGIPLLVDEPATYLAQYRESVLASLAEVNLASSKALSLIDDTIGSVRADAMRYGDDWTAGEDTAEAHGDTTSDVASDAASDDRGEAKRLYLQLVKCNQEAGVTGTVLSMLGAAQKGLIVEAGPGAGEISRALAERCEQLLLLDFSLRSLLRARTKAHNEEGAKVGAILCDLSQFDMASECADAIVAANVVDIIDEPQSFLRAASRWLKADSPFVMTTPDPSLGEGYDEALCEMLESLEYTIDDVRDDIPWLRRHSSRYSQLYWLQAICASI